MLAGVQRRRAPLPSRGIELALVDWGGEGPLALLHHANGFCAAVWAPIAERLRDRFRVVAFDARGHGDSSRPESREAYRWSNFPEDLIELARFLTEEGPQRTVALGVGHSFGGTAFAVAAARCPDLFGRIVMLDPVLVPSPHIQVPPEESEGPGRMAEQARRRRHVWDSPEAILQAWSREPHPFSGWDRRALRAYVGEGFRARPDGRRELKCPGEVEAMIYELNDGALDLYGCAARVRAPTLVVRGAQSHFPRVVFEQLVARMPEATLEEMQGTHLLVMETPDQVADRLVRFGNETKPGSRSAAVS